MASKQWINAEVRKNWHKSMALAVMCLVKGRRKVAKFKSVVVLRFKWTAETNKQTNKIKFKDDNMERRLKNIFLWITQKPPQRRKSRTHKRKHSWLWRDISPFKAYWLRDAKTSLTFNNCTLCPHCIYVFLYLSENKQRLVPLTA